MRLIKKGGGGQNSQIDINARIFSPQVIEICKILRYFFLIYSYTL
jgi:hypothetical protein